MAASASVQSSSSSATAAHAHFEEALSCSSVALSHDEKQEQLLFNNVMKFFSQNKEAFEKVVRVLDRKEESKGSAAISLTMLDWFVTRFARKTSIQFRHPVTGAVHNVYEDYLLQLRAFSKKRSDPFCRSQRFRLYLDRDATQYIMTSTRQLNFFRFVIERGILDYVEKNIEKLHELYVEDKHGNTKEKPGKLTHTIQPACERLAVEQGEFEISFQ